MLTDGAIRRQTVRERETAVTTELLPHLVADFGYGNNPFFLFLFFQSLH